ncbi:uncharacterized protein JCM15063_004673 [Sporobolomyces koalae]|uniref:uncharacterized protein n=1 Tax=Sporobolomyces koalae TaxID=500713 RepID=UPI003177A4A4
MVADPSTERPESRKVLSAGDRQHSLDLALDLAPTSPYSTSFPSPRRRTSLASTSSKPDRAPRMLPSHPNALPHFYDSEASASGDETSRDPDALDDRTSYILEKRRRDEARQRRRARQPSATALNSHDYGHTALAQLQSLDDIHAADALRLRQTSTERSSMPMVYARDGLGFDMDLPDTDYQTLVDEAAIATRAARPRESTYSSSLGSSAPSPRQDPMAPPRPARRVRQTSGMSSLNGQQPGTPRIMIEEPASVGSHVRFDAVAHTQPIRERRSRPRPVSGMIQLEDDHIIFPDTLPPLLSQPVPSPTTATFPPRRSSRDKAHLARPSSITNLRRETASSAASIISQSSLPLALEIEPPVSPRRQTPSFRSGRIRPRSVSHDSTESFPAAFESQLNLETRSARQARNSAGPSTIVGELLVQQDPNRLYFPSPTKSTASVASSDRSPPLSIISSVFPSRPKAPSSLSGPAGSPVPSTSSRMPFPSAPASPVPTSPSRFGRSRMPSNPAQASMPHSPSFASSFSSISALSVEQPVFPTLGAQLTPDGLVRSGVAPRRVSGTPWARDSVLGRGEGDELDRMMAAQRRTASDEEVDSNASKMREKEKDRKRRNIYNELMRTKSAETLGPDGELDSFQRELLARDTVKKSLSATLLSDDPSRSLSELSDDDAHSNGITPSTSADSDISVLPSFPDVPTHTFGIPMPIHPTRSTVHDPEQVEILHSDTSTAVTPIQTPTFSYSYHPTTPKKANRVSLASTVSEKSTYEDAQEEPEPVAEAVGVHATEPRLELTKQQTSLWVLDTLASAVAADSPSRALTDIGEAEEPEDAPKQADETIQASALPETGPTASTSGASTEKIQTAQSELVVPPSPSISSIRQQATLDSVLQRSYSPTLSQGSRSTASTAAVSYTAPPRVSTAASGSIKTKSAFGKRIGALFGGPSYNAAALGLRGSGISSRDVARLERSASSSKDKPDAKPRSRQGTSNSSDLDSNVSRPGSDDRRTRSNSRTSSTYSTTFPPVPSTPPSWSTAVFTTTNPEGQVKLSTTSAASSTDRSANHLADLLSKFEEEEKARFKGIAHSRLAKQGNVVVV